MKKTIQFLLILSLVLAVSCSKSAVSSGFVSDVISGSTQSDTQASIVIASSNMDMIQDNPYFILQSEYQGKFLCLSETSERMTVSVHLKKIESMAGGEVVELSFGPVESVPQDRSFIGCFYITKDRIYKFDRNDEILALLRAGSIPDSAEIVCQEEEIPDALGKDESGWRRFLTVDGNRREYHLYDSSVESGYYERFVWEKGKGLICYFSGWGAQRDYVELAANGYTVNE